MNPKCRMRLRPELDRYVVYDIGAHVGTMALGAALLVGDLGLVVAFDGDPENIARLQEHGARNGLESRLRVVHAAVWSRTAIDGIGFRRGATANRRVACRLTENAPYWAGVKS